MQVQDERRAEPGTVILTRFSPQIGEPFGDKSVSPFSIKVEAFLRMADIPYVTSRSTISSISRNKKRKLPTIITDKGELLVDSTFIISHLVNAEPYASVCQAKLCDGALTPSQTALAHCLKVMCEESLYFIIGYWRYIYEPGFRRYCEVNPTIQELGLNWLRKPAERYARRAIIKQLWAQGTGRHTQDEVEQLGNFCLDSIEAILGDSDDKFLFGHTPSSFDATLFAFLSAILEIELDCPLQDSARSRSKLVGYVQHINNEYGWTNANAVS